MPAKNSVKNYKAKTYYHVLNRGAHKADIFKEISDYAFFLRLLEKYLSKKYSQRKGKLNLYKDIQLYAFCLMPNHYHLLVRQRTRTSMTKLMRRLVTTYSMYFNKKYDHDGHVFQGIYKAVQIYSEIQLEKTLIYIHNNPSGIEKKPDEYYWSSLGNYTGKASPDWLKLLPRKDDPFKG